MPNRALRNRWISLRAAMFGCGALVAPALCEPARAEEAPSADQVPAERGEDASGQIVVVGDRFVVAALADVQAEETFDEERVASFGASTVGELLERLKADKGDDRPSLLVNGRPVSDATEISDLPVEAITRLEVLPRGAAARVGGGSGQRAYNLVLRRNLTNVTLLAAGQFATEGGWEQGRGEVTLTLLRGKDRLNVTGRMVQSGKLFEAERGLAGTPLALPFASPGNVVPRSGSEIDPALSALAGHPVSRLALPTIVSGVPTLSSLLSGIDRSNPSGLELARTLRGSSRVIEENLTGNKVIAPWLELAFSARVSDNRAEGQSGLPGARFLVPTTNAFTPFKVPVLVALNDPARPLTWVSTTRSGGLSGTFNATLGRWRATLLSRWDLRDRTYRSQLTGPISGGFITVADNVNPFAPGLEALIPLASRRTTSRSETTQFALDIDGPIATLPAGDARVRLGGGITWAKLDSTDPTRGQVRFRRHEIEWRAGLTIPLIGGADDSGFLPALGKAELLVDGGRTDLGSYGRFDSYSVGVNWSPLPWVRLAISGSEDGRATAPELLSSPTTVLENVVYFDPLTNQNATVTLISGGSRGLLNEKQRSRNLSLTVTPPGRNNLIFSADYTVSDLKNQIGGVPPPNAAVVLAFPDRFQRDTNGRLVLVDASPVNFAQAHARQLRLSANGILPLSPAPPPGPGPRKPRWQLQGTLTQTFMLESTATVRAGLPTIDLLAGGAIGIGGGQQRSVTEGSLALNRGASGLRFQVSRRGQTFLATGTAAAPDLLTFSALTKIDARAFADLGQIFPQNRLAKGTRLTLSVENLTNSRQDVTNLAGTTPTSFQRAYRDPLGRTVSLELRKVF